MEAFAWTLFWSAVGVLLCQYAMLMKYFKPSLFFNGGSTNYSWTKFGAAFAFVCNLFAVSVAYADRLPETPSDNNLARFLCLQILYYTLQWLYVPLLLLLENTRVGAPRDLNKRVTWLIQVLLTLCAALQIAAYVYLVRANFSHAKSWRPVALTLQAVAMAWVSCYDCLVYSFGLSSEASMPEAAIPPTTSII